MSSPTLLAFAPVGIVEITPDVDLAQVILAAIDADEHGPLRPGDIIVVTSKIVSKHEGRRLPATAKEDALTAETTRTVARRGPVRIVQNRLGITQAAAGIDASNVEPTSILLLPRDPDASAQTLRRAIAERTGLEVGVIISDTSGRAWRDGQTDHAIGLAGLPALVSYAGATDPYGNPLVVTQMAVADELAATADLVKGKLGGRPVAVIRGVAFDQPATPARSVIRAEASDMFRLGSREAVIEAVLRARGEIERYEDVVGLEPAALTDTLTAELDPRLAAFVTAMLS